MINFSILIMRKLILQTPYYTFKCLSTCSLVKNTKIYYILTSNLYQIRRHNRSKTVSEKILIKQLGP